MQAKASEPSSRTPTCTLPDQSRRTTLLDYGAILCDHVDHIQKLITVNIRRISMSLQKALLRCTFTDQSFVEIETQQTASRYK